MKKPLSLLMAVVCLCTMLVMPANAEDNPYPSLFQEALDFLDWGYDYNEEYMIRTVNEEISKNTEGYTYGDTLIVSADEYEALLNKYFVIDNATLENIRNSQFLVYDAEAQTYSSSYLGSGIGGFLGEREYLGYVQNGDTYDVYYRHVTYQYLRDVLPEGTTEQEYVNDVWEGTLEYEGVTYTGHPMYGYYALISRDNYGRKYTVEVNNGFVRIISCVEYTEDEQPATFDDSTTHEHVFTEEFKPQSCTENGYVRSICNCGSFSDIVILASHNWGINEVTVQPTETANGERVYTCSDCGETKRETLNSLGTLRDHIMGTLDGYDYFCHSLVYHVSLTVAKQYHDYSNTPGPRETVYIPAEEYEAMVAMRFVLDDATLNGIRTHFTTYYEDEGIYGVKFVGGMGGVLTPRAYFGYVANEDGTYDVYYKTIPYQYLDDVLTADGATMDDVTISNGTAEYKGIVYNNYMGKYYTVIDNGGNSGKKHTVELNGDIVRIISTTDYTEADLPDSFDDVAPHEYDWDFGTVTVQPTETTTGEIVYTCYCCGETKAETLEALGSVIEHIRRTTDWWDADFYKGRIYNIQSHIGEYFTDVSNAPVLNNPAIVPAQKYEDALQKHYYIDEVTLNTIRNNDDSKYDANTQTYALNWKGAFGGLPRERDYFGYVANDDGTYDVYYRDIEKRYLDDVLAADGATVEDVIFSDDDDRIEYDDTAEYKGVVYSRNMDGDYYATFFKSENTGKKHTVELNGDIVRIISTTDYTEADLPDSFDDVVPHKWSDWTETDTAGTYTRECGMCGASETMTIPQDNTINGTDTETNDAGANLSNTDLELIENVLTEEEQSAVASGETVSINLVVEEFHVDEVPAEDKTKIEEAVEEIVSESDTQIIYLDIDLYKNIGGVETPVTETSGKIKITIDIPDELIDTTADREYKIIRVHDGKVELIDGLFDEETKKFTFETDKFSTYALTYVDTPVTTYTVTYTDGVYGQVVFQDQTYTVEEGSETPAFVGTPNRYGYTFNGWTPAVAETVSADITYTATWTKDSVDIYIPVIFSVNVQDSENGAVSASSRVAAFGSTVKLTVVADDGYELDTLSVKCGNREITTTLTNGTYKFTMPYANVSVTAVFKKIETPVIPDPVVPEPTVPTFKDVAEDAYYFEAVEWAVKNGITNGTGDDTFSPDAECTRAQMVTFLWRAAGSPEPKSSACQFTDVDVNGYYVKAVLWAVEEGITNGTSETTFSPDAECTRAQMATFLYRMAKGNAVGNNTKFVDIDTEAYYAPAVQWAVENAITNGTSDNTFSPDAKCTRGQMVTFLYRLFGKE